MVAKLVVKKMCQSYGLIFYFTTFVTGPWSQGGQFFHVALLHRHLSGQKKKKPIAVLAILGLFAPL
jgi:hypothetical protein